VHLRRLWLRDFRCYEQAELVFDEGLTALLGPNGHGKTNVLEAIGYLASLSSFRGAPNEALVRAGATQAIVRGEVDNAGRSVLIEAEINAVGRGRVQVNKQRLPRARDLLGALRVTVFSPDDLELVKGGPGLRRGFLDDTLVSLHPRYDALRSDLDRVLRQRNTLLKQAGGRLSDDVATTLDVWDAKLAESGEALAAARTELVDRLRPAMAGAYDRVAGRHAEVAAVYQRCWGDGSLAEAVAASRRDDLRRGLTLVGPHRDELALSVGALPARTHASQGEQRSLALAMRLASHEIVLAETGTAPVLLLDDVFSELDPARSDALLANLPVGQAVLSSAAGLPQGAQPGRVYRVEHGHLAVAPAA
jgi:DNA replication and repair protein RecF